ncbi:ABC transporter substrate-binding protein [Halomarina ordinaria]|uniref:ABC transporter substrate-binding protein n=1 Tax=Halomarina ordinaria TaxID=3033939 RepID=A0ABD5UBW4_9EURY|nr:ABC transporter substrate-binding protein [Halomarina sp. PSRA2]
MSDNDTNTTEAPTRRDYIKYGGAVVGGGLLAGCTDRSESESTPTETANATENSSDTGAESDGDDGSYTVELSPVGEVAFDGVPETAASLLHIWADTLASFGQGERVIAVRPGYITSHYERLPGVEVDTAGIDESVFTDDKERFYELDPDVFHVDPFPLTEWGEWNEDDITEITDSVAPFFANGGSRTWSESQYPVDDGYEFYTLEELTQKFAQVYKAEEQAAELVAVREELVSEIQSNLPPESDRPSVGHILYYNDEIYPYLTNQSGFGKAHLTPLGAEDAFADLDKVYSKNGGTLDLEGLLERDPDVLIKFMGVSAWFDAYEEAVETFENDPVGQELTAIQNDRFYRGGSYDQGIPLNLFQLEMSAKQLYPDQFGEWPGFDEEGVLPAIPEDERLFDRQRVADIINGNI